MTDEPPAPPNIPTEHRAARREAIVEAALNEFCERGFAAARVEDVARRAGVAKGTIYLWFKDKEALFQELIRARLGQHVHRLENAIPRPGQSMRSTVESILRPLVEQAQAARMGDLLRLMIAESGRFPALAEFYYREVLTRAMRAVERLAREGRDSGELASDALERFPQLIGAPVVLTLVWSVLFERFAPLDRAALLGAYLDLISGPQSLEKRESSREEPTKREMTDDDAWALEERFWLEGADVYRAHLDPACLMAFPGIGMMRAADASAALSGASRWESVNMTDRNAGRPGAGLIVLAYTAEGHRSDAETYRCFCTSTYRFDVGLWKLIQHQQTPG